MKKEIKYDSDIVEIDNSTGRIYSKDGKKYEIIYSPESKEIQFLIPESNKQILINAETGEYELLKSEDDVEF